MSTSRGLFAGLTFFLQYSDRPKDTFFSDMGLIRVRRLAPPSTLSTVADARRNMKAGQLASL